MSFRKEKKYRLTPSDLLVLSSTLKKYGMRQIHKTRIVSSIYFDTLQNDLFWQSEEGILPRKKIRIRWYNKLDNYTLEKKISSIEGRFKFSDELKNIVSLNDLYQKNLFDKDYGNLVPTLEVSYQRSYYVYNKIRFTFDSDIKYKSLISNSKVFYRDFENVVEIKVPIFCSDDFIEKQMPNPIERFSKYCRGINICNRYY